MIGSHHLLPPQVGEGATTEYPRGPNRWRAVVTGLVQVILSTATWGDYPEASGLKAAELVSHQSPTEAHPRSLPGKQDMLP